MNLFLKNSIILIIILLSVNACSKDEYYTDSGLAKAETPLTVYDYLKNHKYKMFDSLIPIIDYYNIKDTINNAGTFFAPTNNNIKKLLNIKTDSLRAQTEVEDTIYTLTHLFEDDTISSHIILQYAFNDRITLTNATQSGNEYISVKGDTIVIKKIQTTDNQYQEYNPEPVYFLNYSKEGFEDEVCQTADILTQNGSGTVLHVLNNVHTLGLFSIEEED